MYSRKRKKSIVWGIIAVIILVAVAAGVWYLIKNPDVLPMFNENKGGIEDVTYQMPLTTAIADQTETTTETVSDVATTEKPTTEAESYVEQFMSEANTFSQTIESTTTAVGQKPFFHVVTDGTVTDDDSLEGLDEASKTVGQIILAAGFRYDKEQRIFYSESESWQRNFGFTPIYDAAAAFSGMYYDTMRIKFNYADRDWMFQIWKGRYGITTGAELGVYFKEPSAEADFYNCAENEDKITMSFALYHGDELFMTRGPEPHWWLTGFKLFQMIAPQELTMHATFFMEDAGMADAVEESLKDLGFKKDINYQRLGLTMTIIWR